MPDIYGTQGSETITGTADPERIYGLDGDDVIHGLEGDDLIDGGLGNDTLFGGAGTDSIYGGAGDDSIDSGVGGYFYFDPATGEPRWVYEIVNGEDGNDIVTVRGVQDGRYVRGDGGPGTDTLVVDHTASQFFGSSYSGFERLHIQSALNVSYASNFQSITLGGASTNFVNSFNPLVDIALNNQFLSMAFSTFRSVSGGAGDDNLWVGQGSTITGPISLGAGNDRLVLDNYWPGPAPTVGTADGGQGADRLDVWAAVNGSLSLNFSPFTGFETFGFNSEYGGRHSTLTANDLTGISFLSIGWESSIVLGRNNLPGALLMGAYGGSITLEPEAHIGRYGMPADGPWDRATNLSAANGSLSVTFVNNGVVDGDIAFYTGHDRYDGRGGTAGGIIYGNAGDDTILTGSGNDRIDGGYGADFLSGGLGADALTGGPGNDVFADTILGHAGDIIADFSRGDRLIFSDASAQTIFTAAGNVLNFAGGTLTLQNLQNASLAVGAAPEGGLQISFGGPPLIAAATIVPAASSADPFGLG